MVVGGDQIQRAGLVKMGNKQNKRWRAVLIGLLVAAMVGLPTRGSRAESGWLNLHLEGGPAFFLTEPQRDRFGIGGGGGLRADFAPLDFLGFQVGVSYMGFPVGDYDFEGAGLVRPDQGYALMATGGVRFRLLNDQNGYALAWRRGPQYRHSGNIHGNLWIDLSVAYVRTGGLNRVGLEAGLGYELSLVDGLQIGPFVRYFHVFQPDDQLDDADAMGMLAGLSFSVAVPTHARFEVLGDADGDGILDPSDQCPNDPEDFDQFEDEDGCPDLDNDRDGVPDVDDQCPLDPEDRDSFEDEDGCPDPDNDEDGILDVDDRCPDDPEDVDGFEDEDGCPDRDNDQDGILDGDDQCPNEAEVVNGVDDEDGCPDQADIEVIDDDILLRDRVYFDFGMARIRGRSRPLLAQIARLLESHPEYIRVSIEGHCDDVGSDLVNQRLSERRAQRVRDYLIERHHISLSRLEAVGFGRSRPLVRQTTESARQLNRRVEFRIIRIDQSLRRGQAVPRRGRELAPDLGPGGVILPPGQVEEPSRPEDGPSGREAPPSENSGEDQTGGGEATP